MFYKILSAALIISGLLYEPKQIGGVQVVDLTGYSNDDDDDEDDDVANDRIRKWIQQNDPSKPLNLSNLNLTKLENLPPNLTKLECYNNKLTKLENLPPNLTKLDCTNNQLTKLENLPRTLQYLSCKQNRLTKLENLPPNLTEVNCFKNQLTELTNLPPNLQYISCDSNKLTKLENLPPNLITLICDKNQLTKLENLPQTLKSLYCVENPLLKYIVKPNHEIWIRADSHVKILDKKPKEEKKIRKRQPNISKCNNPINIFSQESWDKEDTKDLVYLTFGKRKDCYLVDDLETLLKSSTKVMEWTRNPNARTQEETTGRGYHPDTSKTERYIALPIAQDWVEVNSLEKIIDSEKRKFTMVSNGKKRLGNTEGTFGVSELHGQSELETWIVKAQKQDQK